MTSKKLLLDRVDLGDGIILLHNDAAHDAIDEALNEVAARVFSPEAVAAADAVLRMKRLH
jgi:hypothetical protein